MLHSGWFRLFANLSTSLSTRLISNQAARRSLSVIAALAAGCLATGAAGQMPEKAAPAQAATPAAQTAADRPASAVSASVLLGSWVVDLRSTPRDAAYTQPFVITAVDEAGRSVSGSFYNSAISWSRINTAWGKVVVTFITSDGQGEYVHTATLQGDTLVGSSTARHRNLLVPWTAVRAR